MQALELVGRFIMRSTVADVHTVWSFVRMGSDVLNGFAIVPYRMPSVYCMLHVVILFG